MPDVVNQQHGSRPAREARFRRLIHRRTVTGLDPLRFWYRYRSTARVWSRCRFHVNSSTMTYTRSQHFPLFRPVPRTTHRLSSRQPRCPSKEPFPEPWLRDQILKPDPETARYHRGGTIGPGRWSATTPLRSALKASAHNLRSSPQPGPPPPLRGRLWTKMTALSSLL